MNDNKVLDELEENGDRFHQVLMQENSEIDFDDIDTSQENKKIIEKTKRIIRENSKQLKENEKARNYVREYIRQNLSGNTEDYSKENVQKAIDKEIEELKSQLLKNESFLLRVCQKVYRSSSESVIKTINDEATKSQKIVIFGCTFTSSAYLVGGISGFIAGTTMTAILSMLLFGTTVAAGSLVYGLSSIDSLKLSGSIFSGFM